MSDKLTIVDMDSDSVIVSFCSNASFSPILLLVFLHVFHHSCCFSFPRDIFSYFLYSNKKVTAAVFHSFSNCSYFLISFSILRRFALDSLRSVAISTKASETLSEKGLQK